MRLRSVIALCLLLAAGAATAGIPGLLTADALGADNRALFVEHVLVMQDPGEEQLPGDVHRQFAAHIDAAAGAGRVDAGSLDSSHWRPLAASEQGLLPSRLTLWAVLRIHNTDAEALHLVFRNQQTTIRDAALLIWRQDGTQQAINFGTLHPPSSQAAPHRIFSVPLTIAPGEQLDLLLRIRVVGFVRPSIQGSELLTESELALGDGGAGVMTWFVAGALFLLAVLNLAVAVTLRRRQFALLALISISGVLLQLDSQGYLQYYLWPEVFILKAKFLLLGSAMLFFGTLQFIDVYLELRTSLPRVHRSVVIVLTLILALIVIGLLSGESYILLVVLANWVWLSTLLFLLGVALYLARRGNEAARRMAIIWALFVLFNSLATVALLAFETLWEFNVIFFNTSALLLTLFLFLSALVSLRETQIERDRARAEGQAKSEFLARMSHEIRTPMNGVLGMAELLADTPLNKFQRDYVNVIYNSGRTLLNVINEILDYSKISAGKMTLEIEDIDLSQIARECVALLAAQARAKKLELLCDIDPALPSLWRGDGTRLRQILFNLLGNALKFTERGEIVLSISPLPGNRGVSIAVRDTGIGIAAEQQAQLFDEFSQADQTIARRYGGTGLGLTICKKLLDLMGGTISVDSAPGSGTCFWLELPLAVSAQRIREKDVRPLLANCRVLVVDDNATFRRIVEVQIQGSGAILDCVSSGAGALQRVALAQREGKPYDLVAADIDMPEMTGIELAQMLQPLPHPPRIILVSSTSDLPVPSRCREWGVLFAAPKPILAQELHALFARALGKLEEPAVEEKAAGETQVARHLTVLVAEDNAVNYQVVSTMLSKLGHTVYHARDGGEAVANFTDGNIDNTPPLYDLVLMDCEMPLMDGFEATRQIRALERAHNAVPLRIVALTAHVTVDRLEMCQQAGMDDFLTKPLQIKTLQEKLHVHHDPHQSSAVANA